MKEGNVDLTANFDGIQGINYIHLAGAKDIESFILNEKENQIEVVCRKKSNIMYPCNPPRSAPDKIWKEFYGVENGIIKLIRTIAGTHTPPEYIQETLKFDDE